MLGRLDPSLLLVSCLKSQCAVCRLVLGAYCSFDLTLVCSVVLSGDISHLGISRIYVVATFLCQSVREC